MTGGGENLAMVPSGSTLRKNCWDSGWMTKANLLLRLGPFGYSSRGSRPDESIMSSRSSSVRRSWLDTSASIIASSTAAETVTEGNGWGVVSSTMSTPRRASSASRSFETAEVTTVFPARSSSPNAVSSSKVATTTSQSRAALRARAWLIRVPGRAIGAASREGTRRTWCGSIRIGQSPASTASPSRGLACSRAARSSRRRGSANSRFEVKSRRIRVARSWFDPPRTTVRALLK